MAYSEKVRNGIRQDMGATRMPHACPMPQRFACNVCPWDLYRNEYADSWKQGSCVRVLREMSHKEQLLAICFVACEAGVL